MKMSDKKEFVSSARFDAKQRSHFAGEAKKLAELNATIEKLKHERQRLFHEVGMRLWRLRQEQKRREAQTAFAAEAGKMAALQALISAKELEAEALAAAE
jgi:hypothetical protein